MFIPLFGFTPWAWQPIPQKYILSSDPPFVSFPMQPWDGNWVINQCLRTHKINANILPYTLKEVYTASDLDKIFPQTSRYLELINVSPRSQRHFINNIYTSSNLEIFLRPRQASHTEPSGANFHNQYPIGAVVFFPPTGLTKNVRKSIVIWN